MIRVSGLALGGGAGGCGCGWGGVGGGGGMERGHGACAGFAEEDIDLVHVLDWSRSAVAVCAHWEELLNADTAHAARRRPLLNLAPCVDVHLRRRRRQAKDLAAFWLHLWRGVT